MPQCCSEKKRKRGFTLHAPITIAKAVLVPKIVRLKSITKETARGARVCVGVSGMGVISKYTNANGSGTLIKLTLEDEMQATT